MSVIFSGDELIKIAIDIERRGISFYDVMAKSTDNEMARAAFDGLAAMEREHLVVFQNMLAENRADRTENVLEQQYPGYAQALIDEAVFSNDLITSEMAMQADNDIKAIELGITAEKDSILFYYEIKENLAPRDIPVMERIIAEEKSHLQQLSEIKKKILDARQ
jgi:rubrerythrin